MHVNGDVGEKTKEETIKAVVCCDVCQKPIGPRSNSDGSEEGNSDAYCKCKQSLGTATNAVVPEALPNAFPDLGDRYEVLSEIGTGGMGTVYKVRDKALGKEFAVKVMKSALVQDKISVKRFEQEAEAASSLTHANLAAVYGFGTSKAGNPYLVMDYLDGITLEQVLKQEGFLNASRALDIFTQCADAIANAHMKGIIHRDIKPSNIILEKTEKGVDVVKVVDFGIAKLLPSQQKAYENLTQTGDIFGSPLYMSPEQCQGNMQDRRSDIYSLGCVMYEALTGIQPYAAENPIKIILKHINEDPKQINKLPGDYKIPSGLDQVVMRCLERDPADRYQSADELARDLRRVADGVRLKWKVKPKLDEKKKRSQYAQGLIKIALLGMLGAALYVTFAPTSMQPAMNPFNDAQSFDAKAFNYFISGQYDKAAPLLEFGVSTYKEKIAEDKAKHDEEAARRDECLLAENWEHIGRCYLRMADKSASKNDTSTANEELNKALKAMAQAKPFYYKYGYWQGGSTPEFVHDYADVLTKLGLKSDLEDLKTFAAKWQMPL